MFGVMPLYRISIHTLIVDCTVLTLSHICQPRAWMSIYIFEVCALCRWGYVCVCVGGGGGGGGGGREQGVICKR